MIPFSHIHTLGIKLLGHRDNSLCTGFGLCLLRVAHGLDALLK